MSFYLPRKEKKQLIIGSIATILILVGIIVCIVIATTVYSSQKHNKKINEFVAYIKSNPQENVSTVLDKIRILNSQKTWMSNMNMAEDIVIDMVKTEIENRHNTPERSEKTYQSMLELAEQICAVDEEHKSSHLRRTSVYQFAQSFRQLMNLVQNGQCQLSINKVIVHSTYDDGACIGDCSCKTDSSKSVQLVKEVKTSSHLFKKETNLPGFAPPANMICKPWDSLSVSLYIWEYQSSSGFLGLGGDSWDKKGQKVFSFLPAKYNGVFKGADLSHVYMDIYYSLNYKTLDELYSMYFE